MENNQYIVSARKYRPSTFNAVIGQKALTMTLRNAIATNRLAHAYLFCGSRGVGKTSCARIFAKTINCTNPTADGNPCNECDSCRAFNEGRSLNIVELDAASNNGVDDIRNLVDQVLIPPTTGKYRVFIIDEVHMLSSSAFNAFLKTLEEPPSYAIFILATTEKHKIIPTILSRCQIYDFARITPDDITDHLADVARQEGIEAERSALGVIASKADGAMRDALSIFDQVAASTRGHITYEAAIESLNVLDGSYFKRLCDAFATADPGAALLVFKEIRDKGFDTHFFINGLASWLRDMMAARDARTLQLVDAPEEEKKLMAEAASKFPADFFYKAMSLCNDADLHYREATNKSFLAELLLIKLCQLLSPSPAFSEKEEGHLDSLAPVRATTTVANAAPQATPVTPKPTPVATPQPQTQRTVTTQTPSTTATPPSVQRQSRPQPTVQIKSTGGMRSSGLSLRNINDINNDKTPERVQSQSGGNKTNSARFTTERLHEVWQDYMDARPSEKRLVNTMRASMPKIGDDTTTLTIIVENELQRVMMEEEKSRLLPYLHKNLNNDFVTLNVEVNAGEGNPRTWTDREVYQHLLEKNPQMADFVKELDLRLS
ncbi:MAG: DNA polymerase III subunit gamma/tau [Muribaculaceae bacterium]|nr:DNA polymerase III subunit gamma/tau [Muribaculaceae bacterium]